MNRRWFRWGWLLLLVPPLAGLTRLRFDVEVLHLLPGELPVVRGLQLYQRHFTSGRELLLTLRAPDAATAAAAARQLAESLRAETNLVGRADWQPPLREHPDQLPEFIACLWLNQPTAAFARLTNRLAPDRLDEVLRETRERLATTLSPVELARLSYDPFGFTRLPEADSPPGGGPPADPEQAGFVSADGRFRVVFVAAREDLSHYRACAAWLDQIKAVVDRCAAAADWPGDVTVKFTGAPAFVAEVAGGMERDIRASAACSLAVIAALFWWAHRSWRPLLCLLAMLGLIVAGTLAFGGLIFGALNAVSLGFAAILAGLAVDYGLVLYQEWIASPHLSARDLRRVHAPGIGWSALTTAAAFALLNFAGLPGLSQLGSLVALGVLLAAVVMLYAFLPLVLRVGSKISRPAPRHQPPAVPPPARRKSTAALWATGIVALLALLALGRAWPPVDHSTRPLQPKRSPAQAALDEMQHELNQQGEPLLLVVSGRDEGEVARRLDAVSARLASAVAAREIIGFKLPTALWPHAERQRANLAAAQALTARADALKAAAVRAGFTSDALALAENVFQAWQRAATRAGVIWPTNAASAWTLQRAAARDGADWLAAGIIYPAPREGSAAAVARRMAGLSGVWLTAWPLLGEALLQHVEQRWVGMLTAIIVVIALCLWLAFRRWVEVGLSFATLGFSLLVLLAAMSVAGESWNLMNLMAVPLLLGAGVDYTIHIQRALRREGGDLAAVRRVTGRAVFLCAATTAAGFGSNALSSNAGLASLGLVCAAGVAATFLTAFFLLPAWWRATAGRAGSLADRAPVAAASPPPALPGDRPSAPSASYRAGVWRLGLFVVRVLPDRLCRWIGALAAAVYRRLRPRRFRVVMENLLPVFGGDRAGAARAARRLFREFAWKIADLWRFEGGRAIDHWPADWTGGEFFEAARARGRGVLLVTPHLGNWEFGGAFLARRGVKLLVLTQPEPGRGFTELRQRSRARWGIETLVVGEDAFAFVEIIKRLQAGAVVALLVDRPPSATAVTVELFGRPFQATIAPAELARASGCAVVPTFIVRTAAGYQAAILPEIDYDRATLGDRAARVRLTQEILRAFEPAIREHAAQWYHFVPVWPEPT
jgi:predicted exporter/lauroyl/myristoyl acyltransferase